MAFTAEGVELREASGESFDTLAKAGKLTVQPSGGAITINVDGNAVPWVPSAAGGPFKRLDTRSFRIATTDLMGYYEIKLPQGLPESTYEHLAAIFEAAQEGKPFPAAAPLSSAAAAAAPAAASAPAAAAAAGPAGEAAGGAAPASNNPLGDFLGALAKKAAHDTQMLGSMIQQKAAHDINALQQGGKGGDAKPAGA